MLVRLLSTVLVKRLSFKGDVNQCQESQVHLRVILKVGPVLEDQFFKRDETRLLSEDILALSLDQNISHGEQAVLMRFEFEALVLLESLVASLATAFKPLDLHFVSLLVC